MRSCPLTKVNYRSRLIRTAVSSAVESLESRRLLSTVTYTEPHAPIQDANDGLLNEVIFDMKSGAGGVDFALIGKGGYNDFEGKAVLVNTQTGAEVETFSNPTPATVNQFGLHVAFAGDRIAIAAFDQNDGYRVYVYDADVNGNVDNTHDRVISAPDGAADTIWGIEGFGEQLLVRGNQTATLDGLYLYDLSNTASFVESFDAPNNPLGHSMAGNGTHVLVSTKVGDDTVVREFTAGTTASPREFTIAGAVYVSLAYGSSGEVFIGNPQAQEVYQYPAAGGGGDTRTYTAPLSIAGFGQTVVTSGGHLLVGMVTEAGETQAGHVFDYDTGDKVATITTTTATGGFAYNTAAVPNGFAIGDFAAGSNGLLHVFKQSTQAAPTAELDDNGNLIINGTGAGETIVVRRDNGSLPRVYVNDVQLGGDFNVTGKIVINGGGGNDTLTSDATINFPAEIHGGDGADTITGGGGDDLLLGEGDADALMARAGSDVAVGGDADDIVFGGQGRDVLIGGEGRDSLEGENADDILVSGSTSHDTDVNALDSIRLIWTSGGDYTTRVNALRAGLLSNDTPTVFDDQEVDTVIGGNGQDWFLVNDEDSLGARKISELIDELA